MLSEEEEDVSVVPDVDAVLLLVAGGAEGGAGPRSFGEEGVVAEGAWGREGGGEGETGDVVTMWKQNIKARLWLGPQGPCGDGTTSCVQDLSRRTEI